MTGTRHAFYRWGRIRCLTFAGKEAIWLSNVLSEALKLKLTPTTLRCDNTSAINIAKDDIYHARTKHIDIYYHWIREQVAKQSIHVEFVSTHDNIADIMTKALPEPKVNLFVDAMRLRAWGGVSEGSITFY